MEQRIKLEKAKKYIDCIQISQRRLQEGQTLGTYKSCIRNELEKGTNSRYQR